MRKYYFNLVQQWLKYSVTVFLQPANKVCEGYVFTGVCLSTGGGGVHGRGLHGTGACMVEGHAWWGAWQGAVRGT